MQEIASRRTFLKHTALAGMGLMALPSALPAGKADRVMTVLGEISAGKLGKTLVHEHMLVDFVGAAKTGPHRYDPEAVYRTVLPHLRELKEAGCRTFVDCTPAYLGRDVDLIRRLSQASGMHVLTNTGYYAAADEKFLPTHVYTETAERLAARWIAEWQSGIDGTSIRPGFIKIGVDKGPLPEVSRKLVRAAAITHLSTGLSISGHTGDGAAALEQLDLLAEHGVAANAFRWVHAQNEQDFSYHERAAHRGAYLEFDGIRPESLEDNVRTLRALKERGLLCQLLISQDAGWYSVGEAGGGDFTPYTPVLDRFVPLLYANGFSRRDIGHLLVRNPRKSLTIGIRRA